MIVGEFISADIEKLFNREQRIINQYKEYCLEHGKILDNRYSIKYNYLFVLEIIIKDEHNNRKIKDC